MAQRGTFAPPATRVGGPTLLGPILLGPTLLGVTLTRRPYLDFGYLASAACRG